ncbi:MAG TPA: hypothetical protein VFP50_18255 [Anaeromyxobacteraceae bacterium]|nr:hypothetical protein [Anaeromyxobacteraceae bacterium]
MNPSDILWPAVAAYAVWVASGIGTEWLGRHYAKPDQAGTESATKRELGELIARVENIELAGAMKPRSGR